MTYYLNWNADSGGIEVIIPHKVVERLDPMADTPLIPLLRSNLELAEDTFSGEYDADFGFQGALKYSREADAVRYSGALPHCKMKICHICKGTGKRDPIFDYERCTLCNGSGEAPEIQWKSLHRLRGSFKALFTPLHLKAPDGSFFDEPQSHMEIDLGVQLERDCAWLHVPLSEPLVDWMEAKCDGKRIPLEDVSKAMKLAFDIMANLSDFNAYFLKADCDAGRLRMDVPGNASGIYMGTGHFGQEYGTMFSHNMDSGVQQFTCLAGLAELQRMYREDNPKLDCPHFV
jgi:hypothetical protein